MNLNDFQLIVIAYLINWGTLLFLVVSSQRKQRVIFLNLLIQLIYSILFWYELKYDSEGGNSLFWFLYWLVVIGIHWLVNLIQLALRNISGKK